MKKIFTYVVPALVLFSIGCSDGKKNEENKTVAEADSTTSEIQHIGSIEFIDPAFETLVDKGAGMELLAEGFEWSEGPVWVEEGNYLLFSDIPPNSIYKWSEEDSLSLYLKPSGYTGQSERKGEPGSNGLLITPSGALLLCQHGDRRIALMDAPLYNPAPNYSTLIDNYEGKRLNSPNDAVYHPNGDLFFTDPPYGLEGNVDDPAKEIPFQGVYRLDTEGQIHLQTDTLTRPNGIAFSPDGKILYVANSDGPKAWYSAFDLDEKGNAVNGRIFFDATSLMGKEKGAPDGMVVDSKGNVWATGPGGVIVFNAEGKVIGKLKTGQATANCTLDTGEKYLYITADMYLLRLKLKG